MEHTCPNCHNPIYDDDALLCHFCGESLQRSSSGMLGKMKYTRSKFIPWIVVGLLLLSFFLLLIF